MERHAPQWVWEYQLYMPHRPCWRWIGVNSGGNGSNFSLMCARRWVTFISPFALSSALRRGLKRGKNIVLFVIELRSLFLAIRSVPSVPAGRGLLGRGTELIR